MVRVLQDHTVEGDPLSERVRHLEARVRRLEEQLRSLVAAATPSQRAGEASEPATTDGAGQR